MTQNTINEAAFDWIVRSDAGLTAEEELALETWLAGDERHFGAYMRAKAVWSRALRAKALRGFDTDRPEGEDSLVATSLATNACDVELGAPPARRLARRAFMGALGGMVAAAGTALYIGHGEAANATIIRTRVGQTRDFRLADGTMVSLDTATEIRVQIDSDVRRVSMVTGEALFEVAADPSRPFVIDAAGYRARANVMSICCRSLPSAAPQVIVRNGTVELIPTDATPISISSSTLATVYPNAEVSLQRLTAYQMDEELIWRQGKIAFDNTPLYIAAEKFSRYGSTRIIFGDAVIGNLTITGIYATDDPIGFARAVAKIFRLHAAPSPRGILLTKMT